MRPIEKGVGFESAVGPAVENKIHVVCDQGAVFLDAGLYVNHRGVSGIARGEFFFIIHHQLNRPPRFLGQ